MDTQTCWALPGRLSKPPGACLSPVQVPEIYGWSDFLITVLPSACWPLANPSHLSRSPAAPACSCLHHPERSTLSSPLPLPLV